MNDKEFRRLRRRLILGTIFEYALKVAAVVGSVYLVGWFFAWLCSLITMNMIPFVMGLVVAVGIGAMWYDHKHSIEVAEMERQKAAVSRD